MHGGRGILFFSLCLLAGASALALRTPSSRFLSSRPRARTILASEPDGDDAASDDMSDEALMASFRARLDSEGGSTKFRLKTSADAAVDQAKEAIEGAKDAGAKLLDLGKNRSPADGLLDDNSWKATVGFFAALIVLSVANAVFNGGGGGDANAQSGYYQAQLGTQGGVDTYTSDGGRLEFGRR